jgi:CDP-4-dehydro-6-deoxyglucose reductase/ferredoxin-NAD(P)+ reductase (naphthalene dioxygenase ferredoxin-specific)
MSKVVFPQIGREIEVADGQTILDAALEQGVGYPHSCRQGRCGACKSVLLRGTASMKRPYSRFALSEDELKSGMVLACKAVPVGRAEVAWPVAGGGLNVSRLKGEVSRLQVATHDIMRVSVRLERPMAFLPGQYALLKFGSCESRSYSMANLPEDELVEFHIRHLPGGCASSHVRTELRIGDVVDLTGPLGNAYLREEETPRIVAIAGGSGLAPMQAIVRRAPRRVRRSRLFGLVLG